MKKELKSGILSADKSADKSADGRPTVFWVNVIAVLLSKSTGNTQEAVVPSRHD